MLASGVATVFSAPARIMMKKECLVDSEKNDNRRNVLKYIYTYAYTLQVAKFLFIICMYFLLPGLLAVEQTKSALRGRRSSCRVMEPLEADMQLVCGVAGVLFCPAGSPFKRSSSAFRASLFSAVSRELSFNLSSIQIRKRYIL